MKNAKESRILQTAKDLFIRYGIKRVSVEEICRTAVVSKGTFYKYFQNKSHLFRVLFREIVAEGYTLMDKIFAQDIPFPEKIEKYLRLRIKRSAEFGSLFIEDMNNFDDETRTFIEEIRHEGYLKMITIFQQGQQAGAIRRDISQELFLLILEDLMQLFNSTGLKKILPDSRERLIKITKLMFYGITAE